MTIKEYLSRYRKMNDEINSLCADLSQLRAMLYQTRGGQLDGMPHGRKYKTGANYEAIVDKIADAEEEINKKIDTAVDIRNEISAVIGGIEDDTLRQLLRYRYICCYTWEQTAAAINKSYQWTWVLHDRALKKIKTVDSN